jgi:hypothetical protein
MLVNEERVAQKEYEAKRLFSFVPEAVKSITIQREGERATTGERRQQGGWTVTAPHNVTANPIVWDRVARNLAELLSERTVHDAAPNELAAYGLENPVLKVQATTDSGEAVALSFGSMEPTQKYRYGLVDGGPLFLASPDQFFELDRDLLWLRDRDLVQKGTEGVTRVEFARMTRADDAQADATGPDTWMESVSVVAERRDDGQWYILEPEPAVADQETMNKLAAEFQYAVGREYVDVPESLSDYQLDPPKARIRVKTDASPELQTFYAGAFSTGQDTEGGVFVKREDQAPVFVVDAEMVTLFPKTPTAWNEKRLITRPGSAIASIEYWAGEQHFRLETAEGQPWRLTAPRDDESDQAAVSQFIGALLNSKGIEYWPEPEPEFGLDEPIIRIQLGYGTEGEQAEIRVGALTEDETARYVTQDTGDVVTLPKEQVERFVVAFTDFAPKGLLQFREADVGEVSLIFEDVSYIFARGESAWRVTEPDGKVWESQSDMRALLDGLSGMRAVAIEESPAPADVAPYGLDHPIMTVRLTAREKTTDGSQTIIGPLQIGKLCDDNPHQRYAIAAGRLDLFRVKQEIIDTVRDALRGVVDEQVQ